MHTGQYISGAGHLALIFWVLVGGTLFRSDPVSSPESTDVTLISAADFEGYAASAPELASEAPQLEALAPIEPEEPSVPDAPDPVEAPVPDTTSDAPTPPDPEPAPLIAPPPPPPADRVAPEVAPEPEPEAETAPEVQTATTPEAGGEVAQEAQTETAPEAATTQIITEATETSETQLALAPTATPRPRSRPDRPRPSAPEDAVADAVAAAVAEASEPSGTPDSSLPVGPPLTSGERDALRVAVQNCWNVGSLSSDALRVTVTVGVSMDQQAKPLVASIRMIGYEGGTDAAANQAYETARRAIIRCGATGYGLPAEKYAQWREIEMTFNPERMRIR